MRRNQHSLPRIIIDPTSPQSADLTCPQTPTTKPSTEYPSSRIHPSFQHVLRHLRTPLCPLISSTTGLQHPDFPPTLLAYHLLTSAQLDNLARHFHQVWPPVPATTAYPVTIPPWIGTEEERAIDLQTKQRRFGRFIGLRGCESPTGNQNQDLFVAVEESEEELLRRMQWEWEQGLLRAQMDDPDAVLRWKAGGY